MADILPLSDEDAAAIDADLGEPRLPFLMFYIGTGKDAKVLALPSDGARWALVRLWEEAKAYGGVFASETQLEVCLGSYYQYIPDLRGAGFLDGLECHEWQHHQADPVSARRKRMSALGKLSAAARLHKNGTAIPDNAPYNSPSNKKSNDKSNEKSNELSSEGRTPLVERKSNAVELRETRDSNRDLGTFNKNGVNVAAINPREGGVVEIDAAGESLADKIDESLEGDLDVGGVRAVGEEKAHLPAAWETAVTMVEAIKAFPWGEVATTRPAAGDSRPPASPDLAPAFGAEGPFAIEAFPVPNGSDVGSVHGWQPDPETRHAHAS